MPVRKVSNRGGNIIGYFPSIKMGEMVAFESTIERDAIYFFDYSQEIVNFIEQPCKIPYLDGTKKRIYTPDFLVQFSNGHPVFIECKPFERVAQEANQRTFEIGRRWAANQGATYEVITDRMLRQGYRLKNIKFLTQFARHELPATVKGQIINLIKANDLQLSIEEICLALSATEPSIVKATLLQALYYQELETELDNEFIGMNSIIKLPSLKE